MYSKWNIATECETVEVDPHTCYTQSWPHPQLWPRGSPPRRSSQTLSTFLRSSTSSFRHHSQHNFHQNIHYHQHLLHHDCDIIQRLYHQHNWKNNFDNFLIESPFALLSPSSLPPERCLGSPATNKWIITIHLHHHHRHAASIITIHHHHHHPVHHLCKNKANLHHEWNHHVPLCLRHLLGHWEEYRWRCFSSLPSRSIPPASSMSILWQSTTPMA